MITQKEIEAWLIEAIRACREDHEITCFKDLMVDSNLYLVATWNEDEGRVLCKIAYNCDDLQCDYDIDWYMPRHKDDGDVWDTETSLKEECIETAARYFSKDAEAMDEQILVGNVVCE
jgi:hypothetical protein